MGSTIQYPRQGKSDRTGQIIENGKVKLFVERSPHRSEKSQISATERLKEIKEERKKDKKKG